jgi:hypothetical protein
MMTKTLRIAVVLIVMGSPLHAQEQLGAGESLPDYRGGWTFTPRFGFGETYDDNITLFGRNTAEEQNDDYVATFFPGADVHYAGKHTTLDSGYSGSFLDYQTFSVLNRWDQRARFELRRQESARIKWFTRASAAAVPTTDLIELGGIPFRHNGSRTVDARGGVEYALNATNGISHSLNYQMVDFDQSPLDPTGDPLLGGRVLESTNAWRHKMNSRVALGAGYSYRRATIAGDVQTFNIHTTEAAADYELSPSWALSAGAGVVYLQETALSAASTGPALRATLERHRQARTFHVGYIRSYVPSFGYGGTVANQEIGVGYRTPLFHNRRLYTTQSAVFRDTEPLTNAFNQLQLRSLRTSSVLGWEPQRWVRVEAFYTLTRQTSLRAGGQLSRNRVGFQIVTSKPMRMQ